jgi:hypothetical protein
MGAGDKDGQHQGIMIAQGARSSFPLSHVR